MEWLKDWAVPLSAGAMFLLALAAFWAIRQNYSLNKRARRERLLNEIIAWATNILESEIEVPSAPLQAGLTDQNVLTDLMRLDLLLKYRKVDARSEYSVHIASNFEGALRSAVNGTADNLNALMELLRERLETTTEEDIRELREILELSALAVIEEAAKLKARDIS